MKDKVFRKKTAVFFMFSLLVLLWAIPDLSGETHEEKMQKAGSMLMEGHFAKAEELYREILKENPDDFQAALSLGKICLFKNSLEESETWLKKATELNKEDPTPLDLLAENYYRRKEFKKAAALLDSIDKKPKAEKLRRLAERPAYELEEGPERTVVPFIKTDPLPLVKLRINDSEEAAFLIDTGGWELILHDDFAEKTGAEKLGEQMGTFAGGKQAKTWQGIVDKVEIGDFVLNNVPISISESRMGRLSQAFGHEICGVIGTVFLYQFIFTLDYPNGNLVLERLTEENSLKLKESAESAGSIMVPFWMAGDHFMVAWGSINDKSTLLFIDTGMAGGGFTCSERMLKEAGIQLPEQQVTGVGGGGAVTVKPIQANLALGEARENNVRGFYGALPPGFETRFGFRMGGLISHGFFRPYRVIFDFHSMTLYLDKEKERK